MTFNYLKGKWMMVKVVLTTAQFLQDKFFITGVKIVNCESNQDGFTRVEYEYRGHKGSTVCDNTHFHTIKNLSLKNLPFYDDIDDIGVKVALQLSLHTHWLPSMEIADLKRMDIAIRSGSALPWYISFLYDLDELRTTDDIS